MRFSEMVSRSLAARIESMMVVKDASTSGGTVSNSFQLFVLARRRGRKRGGGGKGNGRGKGKGVCNVQDILEED